MTMTPPTLETIRAALACIPADLPRDEWARVAMALKSELGDAGFSLFDEWSARGETYKASDARTTWRSVKAAGKVGIGTLLHLAGQHGYKPNATAPRQAPTPGELKAQADARRAAAEREQEAQAERHKQGAAEAARLWASGSETGSSAYLQRKQVQNHGGRFGPGGVLLLPMCDAAGDLWNVQTIKPERPADGAPEKLFIRGARKSGTFHMLGTADGAPWLLVAEGYATAGSSHEATGRPVAVAWDAGNLAHVVRALRGRYPAARVAVCGDDDAATEARTGKNPGRLKATEAARLARGPAIFPEGLPAGGTDWNDLQAAAGLDEVRRQIEAALQAAEGADKPDPSRTPDRPKKAAPAARQRPARGNCER